MKTKFHFFNQVIKRIERFYKKLKENGNHQREYWDLSSSESGVEGEPPPAKPLPEDCHVIYSPHSRSHIDPTLVHLVEFVGNEEESDLQIFVH